MLESLASLVSVLEQTQTQKNVDPGVLIMHLTPAEVSIGSGVELGREERQRLASALCSWLRAHEDFPGEFCMRVMFKLLSKVLGQDPAIDGMAVQKGLLSTTTTLLENGGRDSSMLRSCLEVLATLAVADDTDQILTRLGTMQVLVQLLTKHRDNHGVLEDTITTLALMAKRTRHRRALLQGGNVKTILGLLTPGAALWSCATDCAPVQSTLLSSGWLSALMPVLHANPEHLGLNEATLGVVRCLSLNKQYRQEIVALGLIDTTISSIQRFPENPNLAKEGCGMFGNLAADPEISAQLGRKGVLEVVLAVLDSCKGYEDRKASKLAMGALVNLSNCEQNRELLAGLDAGPRLLGAVRGFMANENILEYAIAALSHLAVDAACNRQLVEAGAAEALLLFCSQHREDLAVVAKSLVALRRLLRHAASSGGPAAGTALVQQMARAGPEEGSRGVLLLVKALERHVYDAAVVRDAVLLLTAMASVAEYVPVLMQVAVRPCRKALEVHQNDAQVGDALAGFLATLPLEDDEEWAEGFDGMAGQEV